MNTAEIAAGTDYEAMAAILGTSGLDLARSKTPVGVLEQPQEFRSFVDRSLAKNKVKLRWKRPLNTASAADVSNYLVRRGTTLLQRFAANCQCNQR